MRFRLLSYVAAMLLLAGVLGANLTPISYPDLTDAPPCPILPYSESWFYGTARRVCYGWPCTPLMYVIPQEKQSMWLDSELVYLPPPNPIPVWSYSALVANIAIGLAIPIAGLFACEFVLRRFSPKANN